MLAAAVAAGVPRLVHTSSSAAIMDTSGLVAPPALTDPYSTSKAETLVLAAARQGRAAMIVNPVSVYGPSPRGPLSCNGLFLSAAHGEVQTVVDAPVGWVLAEDAAAGHLLALERGEPGPETHRRVDRTAIGPSPQTPVPATPFGSPAPVRPRGPVI